MAGIGCLMLATCDSLDEMIGRPSFSEPSFMNRICSVLVGLLSLASVGFGQEIFMIEKGGSLASLDPSNGQVSIVGSTGIHGLLWDGLAIDSQGRIFAAYGDWIAKYGIYEIDPNTGRATFVAQTSLGGIRSLAFDSNDTLYAIDARNAPLIDTPYDLHTVDLSTGTTNSIGDTWGPGSDGPGKLTFADDILWAHNVSAGLVQIDVNTGISVDVNPQVPALPFTFPDAICSTTDDTLYYIGNHLWILDRLSGAVSQVALVSLFASWSGAVFLDSPTRPFSLWFGGTTNGPMEIRVAGGTPSGVVALAWSNGPGGPTPIPGGFPCSGVMMSLNSGMRLLDTLTLDIDGKASMGPQLVPASASQRVHVQAIDLTTCRTSNVAVVWY